MNTTFGKGLVLLAILGFISAFLQTLSSPLILFLLSPVVVLTLVFGFLVSYTYLAHWLDVRRNPTSNGLSAAARPLVFSTPAAWQAVLTRSQWTERAPQSYPSLYPQSQMISATLNEILILIVRDFVLTWYTEISTSPSFPTAVSSVLHASVAKLITRAENIDVAAFIVKRILPKVTAHIEQFRQSEMALRGAGLERRLTQSEELDLLLASRYSTKGGVKLHSAIDNLSTTFTKQTEEVHLRTLVEKALPYVLPEKEANSHALKLVVREIIACSVLYPIMDMVSDPDFWNRLIDQIAGAAIHQQRLITKVRNLLEAQSPHPRKHSNANPTIPPTETITIRTDVRQFESFLRSINRCSSLLDARRLKNDIVGEIRRTRMLLGNHEKEDWINGEKTEDIVAFLDRLYTAKRRVEERIIDLGGEDHSRKSTYQEIGFKSGLTLRDILRNPSSLSYFMEFMDRRHRLLLVQFWLTVESFKNPLESVDSDSSGEDDEPIQDPAAYNTVKEDITMINDLYFSSSTPHPTLSFISPKYVDSIRAFARSEVTPSFATQRRVRRSVMLAQQQVEKAMEQDFEEFERSELWFRVIGDTDPTSQKPEISPHPHGLHNLSHHTPQLKSSPNSGRAHHPAPQFLPGSEASGSAIQRTTSAGSHHSNHSLSSNKIELLMSSADEADSSRAPLFDDPGDDGQDSERAHMLRMAAIQAALTDIIAFEQEVEKSTSGAESQTSTNPSTSHGGSDREQKRKLIFEDDEDDDIDYEREAGDRIERSGDRPESFHLADPGNLRLTYDISRLADKITRLQTQDSMLDNLIKKAELTGDTQELRLLKQSKASLNNELRQLIFQKTQYEQQESANRLFSDRTRISIVSSTIAEEDGKSVVRYLVEVQQLAPDRSFASGWIVARRYNEFLNMHNKLRDRYALVRNLDFPGKRLVPTLSGSSVDSRRVALEKYLQNLVSIPATCESDELRAFLSRDSPFIATDHPTVSKNGPGFSGTELVRSMYRSVAESIDDMFFGPSMLDVMIQRLTRHAAEFAGIVGSGVNDEDLVAQALNATGKTASEAALLHLSGDLKPLEGETSTSTFSSPICDLVLAIFELKKQNNWLRRQAIVIILQQVLGGTIERKIRETVRSLLEEPQIMSYISLFRNDMWPGGKLNPPSVPRTAEEKLRTREEANRKLSSLIPDLAANTIGRSNARRGARRMFAVLQNRRLNQHIAYTVVDELFAALFPETCSVDH